MKPITLERDGGAYKATMEQARTFLSLVQIDAGQAHGEMKTFGPWQIPVSYTAVTASRSFEGESYPEKHSHPLVVFGIRTMSRPRQSGYQLEGHVSIGGKKYRAFTSSALIAIDGHLVDVAIIHVCGWKGNP